MSYKKLKKKIDKITEAYGRLEEAVVSLETYSYQYNIKIVRMPTLSDQETPMKHSKYLPKLIP